MNNCGTCKHWDGSYCKVIGDLDWGDNSPLHLGGAHIVTDADSGYPGTLVTSENFGCIKWELK